MSAERPASRGAAASGRSRRPAPRTTVFDGVLLGFDTLWVLLVGALNSVPAAYPSFWWVQILCAAVLAWQVGRAAPLRAAWLGLVFGVGWLVAGTWWLYISMHHYGGLSAALSVMAVIALSVALSLYLAAAMALFARLRRNRTVLDALLFGACWLVAELARGVLFTGFPWAASGYGHVEGPLATLAPWIGVYGIGFVAASLGAALVLGMRDVGRRSAGALFGLGASATVLIALVLVKPVAFTQPTGTLAITLLQSNVPQEEKFQAEHLPEALLWAQSQLLAARGELVVGPETLIPLLPDQLPADYWNPLLARFQRGEQAALIGRPLGSFETGYTNSVVGLSRDAIRYTDGYYRYDKYHLVPFGEFIPTGFRWFTDLMHIPLGDFSRGVRVPPSFSFKGERIAPNICYEDLFGEELAARFAHLDSAPTILANISNIGWFGDTIAIDQHQIISRMRAIEFQRPMVRATNTGATVVIDHHGTVTHALPPYAQGVLDAQVQGRQGLTPYAVWAARFGLWPLLVLALAVMLLALPLRRRT